MRKGRNGFTLMELMIAIAIVSILSVVAITIYTPYIRKGRRMDGINTLLAISLAQEHYRSNNSQYGTLAQVWTGTTSPEGYYTLAVSGASATGYTLTATAVGTQSADSVNGVSCNVLTFTMSAGTVTKAPATCWPK